MHRADGKREKRRLALRIGGKSTGEGAGQIQVIPDGVVRDAGVGGQQFPQLAELAVVVAFAQVGCEAPECEKGFFAVQRLAGCLVFQCQQQPGMVVEAAFLDVVKVGVGEATVLAQVKGVAGQGMQQHRLVCPAHLRPMRHLEGLLLALLGGDGDFLHRPLRAVGCSGPPVGALHMAVHGAANAFFEHGAHQGFVVVGVQCVGGDGV